MWRWWICESLTPQPGYDLCIALTKQILQNISSLGQACQSYYMAHGVRAHSAIRCVKGTNRSAGRWILLCCAYGDPLFSAVRRVMTWQVPWL